MMDRIVAKMRGSRKKGAVSAASNLNPTGRVTDGRATENGGFSLSGIGGEPGGPFAGSWIRPPRTC